MLHKDTFIIAPKTFTLIQQLQKLEILNDFYLVGGTALALQLGHRNSIDIDLFTTKFFEPDEILSRLKNTYEVQEIFKRGSSVISLINNIKTDFIRHDYPYLRPFVEEEGIRMLSMEDIAAMKVHTIAQSGKRLKDFIDIYFLLEHFSVTNIIDLFTQKYDYISPMVAVKAINYFDEIDESIDPPKLLKPLPFSQIKQRIQEATLKANKVFRG